jgi:hypothetical protein
LQKYRKLRDFKWPAARIHRFDAFCSLNRNEAVKVDFFVANRLQRISRSFESLFEAYEGDFAAFRVRTTAFGSTAVNQ